MYGQVQFASVNSLINARLADVGTLIVAHRGTGLASVADNTTLAVRAALLSGADMVEIDVTASADGVFYCFHDGYEHERLGVHTNLQTLTAEEIDHLSYIWVDRPGRHAPVERLLKLLRRFRGDTLFNIDRSWWRWPQLLQALDTLDMARQFLIKCPAWESAALERLRQHPVKYPFMPICGSLDDIDRVMGDEQTNLLAVELITTTQDHPWFDPGTIADLHARGVFCFVNSETLTTGIPLFGGLDDELAIRESPEAAYGPMFDLGIDAIQTDWPWLVRQLRTQRQQELPGSQARYAFRTGEGGRV